MIRVQESDFDVGTELARLATDCTDIGGVATFLGFVRGQVGGIPLITMTLEHYPGMTERQLTAIEATAKRRWQLYDTLIVHRVGQLRPGERIVLVATAAHHRAAAFEACQFLIDWLKTHVTLWKLEETAHGSSWVESRAADITAKNRWNSK
ncbi:Molybdenum cofactor biosynthesis protein MoaE [invertebrate metagenome]|uniref:Molybdenum cofactor biosynthesis protein MoaE n=1 Tax=invertebrate metagenome TaxID=1711999 RepID=A0A484H7Z7_9ZZZZ